MTKPLFSAGSSAKILRIIYDYEMACCAYVAARLNIAELLYEGPKTVDDLALATGSKPEALYRVLRVLAGEGLFEETSPRTFSFTQDAIAMHGETEGSIKYFLQVILGEHYYGFGNMLYSVRTGETAFDDYYKLDVWAFYEQHPDLALNFNKAMAGMTQYYSKCIIPSYDFGQFSSIVDIGGGNGALLFAILNAFPHLQGTIYDAASVVPQARTLIEENGLQERCTAVAGNFFERVPAGADAYLMKYILHDWNDEGSVKILHNCAAVMNIGSKVLVLDAVIPPGNNWHPGKHMDVTMLAATKGRERSEEDFRKIFSEAGLQFNRVIDIGLDEISIVEAEKK